MRPWPLLEKQNSCFLLDDFLDNHHPSFIDELGFYHGSISRSQCLQNLEQGASLLQVLVFALEDLSKELESMENRLLFCGAEPGFRMESIVLWKEMRQWILGWIRETTYCNRQLFQRNPFRLQIQWGDLEEYVISFPHRFPQKMMLRMKHYFSKPSLCWEETSDYLCEERLRVYGILENLKHQQLFFVEQGLLMLQRPFSGKKRNSDAISEEAQKMAEWIKEHLSFDSDEVRQVA